MWAQGSPPPSLKQGQGRVVAADSIESSVHFKHALVQNKGLIRRFDSHPARPVRLELRAELRKLPCLQRLAHFAHQVQVVVQVVDGGEHGAEHFAAAVQVVQVGAAETTPPALAPRHARAAGGGGGFGGGGAGGSW